MKPKITHVKEENGKLTFKLKGVPVCYANALRRFAMGQVKTYAIDKITVYENTSAFFDEYIANRIGLIPINTPERLDEEVLFSLNAEGPVVIKSGMLESSNPKVTVANKNIPIIELANKQVLRLEGVARKGVGREHAKFQPANVAYSYDEEGEYEFVVEPFGQMDAKTVINRALKELIERCKQISKEV